MIGYCGGGIKELKNDLKEIFDEKEIERLVYEMQKNGAMGERDHYTKSNVWTD